MKYVKQIILIPVKKEQTLIYTYRLLNWDYVRTYIFYSLYDSQLCYIPTASHLTKILRIKSHKENSVFRNIVEDKRKVVRAS